LRPGQRWSTQLAPFLTKKPSIQESLILINNMLPTRIWVTEVLWRLEDKLRDAITLYVLYEEAEKSEQSWNAFYGAAVELFEAATQGIYPLKGRMLDFYEFTANYASSPDNSDMIFIFF